MKLQHLQNSTKTPPTLLEHLAHHSQHELWNVIAPLDLRLTIHEGSIWHVLHAQTPDQVVKSLYMHDSGAIGMKLTRLNSIQRRETLMMRTRTVDMGGSSGEDVVYKSKHVS